MAYKAPVPESPYFPSDGLNADASGLSIKKTECSDILNMRISRREVFTRPGCRRIAFNTPSDNPILHMHEFKAPNGVKTLFGFTKNYILKYNDGTGSWDDGITATTIDTCEAVTGFSTALDSGIALTNERVQGSYSVGAAGYSFPAYPINTIILQKSGAGILDVDLRSYTKIKFWFAWYSNASSTTRNFTLRTYSDESCTTLIEALSFSCPRATVINSHPTLSEISLAITSASYTHLKSWSIEIDEAIPEEVPPINLWTFIVDDIRGVSSLASDVEFWHTTDFIDNTYGSTVVATGSSPNLPAESEDDAAIRVMYFYNTSTGYFSPLTQYRLVTTGDEDSGQVGPSVAGVVTDGACAAQALSGFNSIYKGTFSIYTLEYGTVATSSAVLDSGKYALVPVDYTKTKGGTNSFVYSNGTGWSLEFLDGTYSGLKLYMRYTYKITAAYKPRYVWNFHNRLIMGSTYESSAYQPWRLRWTEVADITLVTETARQDLIDTDITPIQGGALLGFYLNIYKQDSIIKGSYIGGDSTFLFNTVWKDGTYAGRTLQSFEEKQYYLGKNDVFVFDGAQAKSITITKDTGAYRIRDKLFTILNQDKILNCFSCLYPKWQEYWLWIVRSGETYPTSVFVYNILLDIWYYFEFLATTCTGVHYSESDPTIDELVGTIDEQYWTMESASSEATASSIVMARSSGDVYILDDNGASDYGYYDSTGTWVPGTTISTRFITRDFVFSGVPQQDRITRVDFEAMGVPITWGNSHRYTVDPLAFQQSYVITPTSQFEELNYFPDRISEHIRFCLTATGYWSIRWIQPYAVTQELVNE